MQGIFRLNSMIPHINPSIFSNPPRYVANRDKIISEKILDLPPRGGRNRITTSKRENLRYR